MADTGSEHVIVSPKVADDLGIECDKPNAVELAFAGREQLAYPASVRLSLLPPPGVGEEPAVWDAEVLVATHWVAWFDALLGQRGFLDMFTATFSHHATAFAVEDLERFDDLFPAPAVDLGDGPRRPRLRQ